MAKTKPIGVRFDEDLIKEMNDWNKISTPQGILNYLTDFFRKNKLFVPTQQPVDKFGTVPEENKMSDKSKKTLGDARRQYPLDPDGSFEYTEPNRAEIEKQIQAIREEKIPPERNTTFGKKVWAHDQEKRIQDLQSQLK